jgi:energy-coupling factor transporter transmembrane protein EcfT
VAENVFVKANHSLGVTLIASIILGVIATTCIWIVVTLIQADLWQPLLWVPIGIAAVSAFVIVLLIRRLTMRALTISPEGIKVHRPFAPPEFIPAGGLKAGIYTEPRIVGGAASATGSRARTSMYDVVYLGLPDGTIKGLLMRPQGDPSVSRIVQGLGHLLDVQVVPLQGDPAKKMRRALLDPLKA